MKLRFIRLTRHRATEPQSRTPAAALPRCLGKMKRRFIRLTRHRATAPKFTNVNDDYNCKQFAVFKARGNVR